MIIDCEQGSPEWRQFRLGIPTASMFSAILAKGEGKTRATYMRRLAGEIITGQPAETFRSLEMERGTEMEAGARDTYAAMVGVELTKAGMFRNHLAGCSPDALVGDNGLLEIKTKKPELLIAVIDSGKFPSEHVAQCQGALWVCEREWIDLLVYYPGMPMFVKRAPRDEEYIAKLADEVARFNDELANLVNGIRSLGLPAAPAASACTGFVAVELEN